MIRPKTLIGLVGYTPVLDAYPLGPRLMAGLTAALADLENARIENMTWGPIHVVQRFQGPEAERFDRLVLIGAASVSVRPGEVAAWRWTGGSLPDAVLQERIYEGITGIVDIENTLAIGEHFGVWPDEVFTVEADLPADAFGRMVIADSEGWGDEPSLARHLGFSPAMVLERLVRVAAALARDGEGSDVPLGTKTAGEFAPVVSFMRTVAVAGGRRS